MDKICKLEEKQTPKCSDILLSKKLQNIVGTALQGESPSG
jgi:hypothetical protein